MLRPFVLHLHTSHEKGYKPMRIHTTLTAQEIREIGQSFNHIGVAVQTIEAHGSRKRARRLDVGLSGHSIAGGAYGALDYTTATYDEWGMFIAAIYERDETAIVGPYTTQTVFRDVTQFRFDQLDVEDMCKRHRWNAQGNYYFYCPKCGAERWTRPLIKR